MRKIIIAQTLLSAFEEGNTIFKRKGFAFFSASSSEEILAVHREKKADLIITEAVLPLMGGAKLCSLIRSDVELKKVSIIVVGDENDPLLPQCHGMGANVVIRKPVEAGALLWKASELLVVPQRKDMRVLLRVSIQGMQGNTHLFAKSQDISISGMQLETDRVLIVGDYLTCSYHIAHSEVSVTCMVIRVQAIAAGRYRYGVRFMNCDKRSLVIIEQFVRAPYE